MSTTVDCYEKLLLINPLEPVGADEQRRRGLLEATPKNIDTQFGKLILLKHPELKPCVPQVVNQEEVTTQTLPGFFHHVVEIETKRDVPTITGAASDIDPFDLLEASLRDAPARQESVKTAEDKQEELTPELTPAELEKRKEEFEEIYRAYIKLKNNKYKSDYPEAGFFEIVKPAPVKWFYEKFLNKAKDKKQQEQLNQRNDELENAVKRASVFEKIRAAAAGLLYGLAILTVCLTVTAIALAVIPLSLIAVWVAPSLVPNIIKKKVKNVLKGKRKESKVDLERNHMLTAKLLGTFFSVCLILASPLIGFLLVSAWIYGSVTNGYKAYQEIAARGMNDRQKTALAMAAVAITAVLLVAFPPLGLAATLGCGGWIAGALGMAKFSLAGLAAGLASVSASITGVVASATYGISRIYKRCFEPKYTYPSLQELAVMGLHIPLPKKPPVVVLSGQDSKEASDETKQASPACKQRASKERKVSVARTLPFRAQSTKTVLGELDRARARGLHTRSHTRSHTVIVSPSHGMIDLDKAKQLCAGAQSGTPVDAGGDILVGSVKSVKSTSSVYRR